MDQPLVTGSGPLAPLSSPLAGALSGSPPAPPPAPAAPAPAPLSFQDEQALSQLRRGNWAAMEGLVQRYQDRLYVTLLRMVGHPEDAADLVQETFVRAMQAVARFEGKSSLYTWLFRIAINLAISHRRAGKYRSAASLDAAPDDGEGLNKQAAGLRRQIAQETEADPALSAQQRLDYERLLVALSELEPDFRAVIVLRDIDECDYEQMAGILDVPVGTVKSRLFRARSALRERLRPDGRLPA